MKLKFLNKNSIEMFTKRNSSTIWIKLQAIEYQIVEAVLSCVKWSEKTFCLNRSIFAFENEK